MKKVLELIKKILGIKKPAVVEAKKEVVVTIAQVAEPVAVKAPAKKKYKPKQPKKQA